MSLRDVSEARQLPLVDPQLHRCFLFDLPGPLELLFVVCVLFLVVSDVSFQFSILSFKGSVFCDSLPDGVGEIVILFVQIFLCRNDALNLVNSIGGYGFVFDSELLDDLFLFFDGCIGIVLTIFIHFCYVSGSLHCLKFFKQIVFL